MKAPTFLSFIALLGAIPVFAQQPPDAPPAAVPNFAQTVAATPPAATPEAAPKLTPEELQKLVAPIALYPDVLLTIVMQAATVPTEIVLAARFLATNPDPAKIDAQPWDDSVRALARYPDVIKFMDARLDWTMELGNAVMTQQGDLLQAVQTMRTMAESKGNLQTTSEQKVIREDNNIIIQPAQPNVIFVPQFDPTVIYTTPYSTIGVPLITFGAGFAMGAWFNSWPNWNNRYIGVWGPGYRPGAGWGPPPPWGWRPPPPNWRPPPGRPGGGGVHPWRPPANRPLPGRPGNRPGAGGGINRPGDPGIRPPGSLNPPGGINRPGGPGIVNPPGGGNRPGAGTGNRPGGVDRPGAGTGNRPGSGSANRPGNGTGNRPNINPPNRPTTRPAMRPSNPAGGTFRPGQSGPQTRQYSNRGQTSRAPAQRPQMNRPQGGARPPASRPSGGRPGGGGRRH